jgi:hypothetical protein
MSRRTKINVTLITLNALAAAALLLIVARHRCKDSVAETDHLAGLDRIVTNVVMDGMPLRDVLQEFHRQTGATFVLSSNLATRKVAGMHFMVPNGPGWQTPMWGTFHNVTLDDALNALCRQSKFAAPLHYQAMKDGRILLGADDEMPWVVRAYDVRNLTALMPHPKTDSLVEDDSNEQDGPVRQFYDILIQTDEDRDGISIDPKWRLVNGRLFVVASARAQDLVAAEIKPLEDIHQSFPAGSPLVARNGVDLTGR